MFLIFKKKQKYYGCFEIFTDMKKGSIIIVFILAISSVYSQALFAPNQLRCDFLLHTGEVSISGMQVNKPIASAVNQKDKYQFAKIYSENPVFNWQVDTSVKQVSAYRILVASSVQLLNSNDGDFWNSRKTKTLHSRAVYNGKSLVPGKLYYWKVKVWNDKNIEGSFSNISSFFLHPKDSSDNISHYPLAAEIQRPVAVNKKNNGDYFLDFGKDAFGQLILHLSSEIDDSILVEVGEAKDIDGNILKTNGNIRYAKQSLSVKTGAHKYAITWPPNEKRNHRNSPILMPDYIGEVFPFRYVSIKNFTGTINKKSIQRKIIFYPFDDKASSFVSSDSVLNKVWDLCKYSEKATSFTGYYIDGDRERVPYEADALINQLSHYAVDPEYSMARRSMAYVISIPHGRLSGACKMSSLPGTIIYTQAIIHF